jgi:adenylate kinase family enzyme
MAAYNESTAPLIDFYRKRNLLLSIPATGTPSEICARTLQGLNQRIQVPLPH